MNSAQRRYLSNKVSETSRRKIEELRNGKVKYPRAGEYIKLMALQGQLKVRPVEEIRDNLVEKIRSATDKGHNWTSSTGGWAHEESDQVTIAIEKLVYLPDDFYQRLERAREINRIIDEKVKQVESMTESLNTRVMLASARTLQPIIDDIDAMGAINLETAQSHLLLGDGK